MDGLLSLALSSRGGEGIGLAVDEHRDAWKVQGYATLLVHAVTFRL
jgi:hypothetical protein